MQRLDVPDMFVRCNDQNIIENESIGKRIRVTDSCERGANDQRARPGDALN
jgi:hypothetical protein